MSKGVQLKDNTGEKVYPRPFYAVGDLYLTTNTTNPNLLFGGVWELFGPGRCLVCVDTSQTEFNSVSKTGGAKTHTLTTDQMPSHSHSAGVNNGGEHQHTMWFGGGANSGTGAQVPVANSRWGQDTAGMSTGFHDHGGVWVAASGGGQAHNNLQPFITCYVWRRTA